MALLRGGLTWELFQLWLPFPAVLLKLPNVIPPLLLSAAFVAVVVSQSHMSFTIGSVESFERNLEAVQQEMNVDPSYWVPVTYVRESEWL